MDTYETTIDTPRGTFTIQITPVRTQRPHQRRQRWTKATRIRLLHVQNFRCAICQGPMGFYESHIDHIIPLAAGGTDALSNLQLTHGSCNLRKGVSVAESQEAFPWA